MSSTNRAAERRLKKFFDEQITPVAERLRREGTHFFATRPDASVTSYYETHSKSDNPFVEIEFENCESLAAQMWHDQGYPELAELSGPLFALAEQLVPPEEESADVSPFIYVMF